MLWCTLSPSNQHDNQTSNHTPMEIENKFNGASLYTDIKSRIFFCVCGFYSYLSPDEVKGLSCNYCTRRQNMLTLQDG